MSLRPVSPAPIGPAGLVMPAGAVAPSSAVAPLAPVSPSGTRTNGSPLERSGLDLLDVIGTTDLVVERGSVATVAMDVGLESARAALLKRQPAETLAMLDRVWARAQRTEEGWYLRSGALTILGLPGEAERMATEGLERKPESIALRFMQSLARLAAGDVRGARSAIVAAIDLAPPHAVPHPVLLVQQAIVLAKLGQGVEAERVLRQAASAFPDHPAVDFGRETVRAAAADLTRRQSRSAFAGGPSFVSTAPVTTADHEVFTSFGMSPQRPSSVPQAPPNTDPNSWSPPDEGPPFASTPSASTPSALTPSALTPSALTPSALTPSALTQSASTQSASTPSALTPSALTPFALPPSAAPPSASSAAASLLAPDPEVGIDAGRGYVAERAVARLGAGLATSTTSDLVREGRVLIRALSAGGTLSSACPPDQAHAARVVIANIVFALTGSTAPTQAADAASPLSALIAQWLPLMQREQHAEAGRVIKRLGASIPDGQRKLLEVCCQQPFQTPPSGQPPVMESTTPRDAGGYQEPMVQGEPDSGPHVPIRLGLSLLEPRRRDGDPDQRPAPSARDDVDAYDGAIVGRRRTPRPDEAMPATSGWTTRNLEAEGSLAVAVSALTSTLAFRPQAGDRAREGGRAPRSDRDMTATMRAIAMLCVLIAAAAAYLGHGTVAVAFGLGAAWLGLRQNGVTDRTPRRDEHESD